MALAEETISFYSEKLEVNKYKVSMVNSFFLSLHMRPVE